MYNTVLLNESIVGLNIYPRGKYLDCTFGHGGHSRLILSKLNKYGKLFSLDCDVNSINMSLNINNSCLNIIHGCFSNILNYIAKFNLLGKINGILFDLGVSFFQIFNIFRGFSYKSDSFLDMRMNKIYGFSASQWLSIAKFEEIYNVFNMYGGEYFIKRIVNLILSCNINIPITRTIELSNLIINLIPFSEKKKHPATRIFQAIRIFINNELNEINKALNDILLILAPLGRLVIIGFNSLEHKLIKNFYKIFNLKFDFFLNNFILKNSIKYKFLKLIRKIQPTYKEVINNLCSRSSILYVLEKICFN